MNIMENNILTSNMRLLGIFIKYSNFITLTTAGTAKTEAVIKLPPNTAL